MQETDYRSGNQTRCLGFVTLFVLILFGVIVLLATAINKVRL
jgi:hypothetical protein